MMCFLTGLYQIFSIQQLEDMLGVGEDPDLQTEPRIKIGFWLWTVIAQWMTELNSACNLDVLH